jgi:hypothetical protein
VEAKPLIEKKLYGVMIRVRITMELCGGGYCYLTETAREVLPFDSEHQPAVRSSDGLYRFT